MFIHINLILIMCSFRQIREKQTVQGGSSEAYTCMVSLFFATVLIFRDRFECKPFINLVQKPLLCSESERLRQQPRVHRKTTARRASGHFCVNASWPCSWQDTWAGSAETSEAIVKQTHRSSQTQNHELQSQTARVFSQYFWKRGCFLTTKAKWNKEQSTERGSKN